jgi:hypothetical protein
MIWLAIIPHAYMKCKVPLHSNIHTQKRAMANLLRSTLRSLVASNTHKIPGGLMAAPNNNLALLIDGDNASAQITVGLMAEIANYGTASVRRIYGDWIACSITR